MNVTLGSFLNYWNFLIERCSVSVKANPPGFLIVAKLVELVEEGKDAPVID